MLYSSGHVCCSPNPSVFFLCCSCCCSQYCHLIQLNQGASVFILRHHTGVCRTHNPVILGLLCVYYTLYTCLSSPHSIAVPQHAACVLWKIIMTSMAESDTQVTLLTEQLQTRVQVVLMEITTQLQCTPALPRQQDSFHIIDISFKSCCVLD